EVRANSPAEERFAAPDRRHERLTVAVPDLFPPAATPPRTPEQAREPDSNRQIEPDDHVGRLQDEIAQLVLVRAVDHPAVGREHGLDLCTKLVVRCLDPVRAVDERIELDEGHTKAAGELSAERRLAVPA